MLNFDTFIISPFYLFPVLSEIWLSIIICIFLIYIVLPGTKLLGQSIQVRDVDSLIITCLLIALWLTWNYFQISWQVESTWIAFNGLLQINNIILLVKITSILATTLTIIISREYYIQEKIKDTGHNILIVLALLGILLLVSGNDLLSIYLAIELQSLSFYTLATLKRDQESSVEAGLKYFVLGALSSGILLLGAGLIYGSTGTINLDQLTLLTFLGQDLDLFKEIGLLMGLIFIGIAFLFKIAAAPFHMWVPDVYQGSPTSITAFFAIVPKLGILILLTRLYLDTFLGLITQWQPLIILCTITSMIVGSFGALNQSLIKRLFAYSAISHIGYVLIALIAATHISIQALLVYMIIYMIMTVQSFGIILSSRKKLDGRAIQYLIEFIGLSRSQPVLVFSFTISLLSLAGIPPLAGFFSKWLVFSAAIQSHLYLLTIIGVWTSVLASVYYLRVIINMYARYPKNLEKTYLDNSANDIFNINVLLDGLNPLIRMDQSKSLTLGWTTFLILVLLFIPTPLLLISHQASILFLL